jgi:formate dehydrogenase subunit gamma
MTLVALQEIQAFAGYIPAPAVGALATALGVPEGDVLGVIGFYPELRTTPPGRHRVSLCRGDSCAARGAHHIAESIEAHLGIPHDGTAHGVPHDDTTRDEQFTYDTVYCLGNCALSPSIAIDEEVYGRCTPDGVVRQLRGLSNE